MKFSDTLISWKPQNEKKNKLNSNSIGNNKIAKDQFVQDAVGNPDFDQTVLEVYQRSKDHLSLKEQRNMDSILKKVKVGKMDYSDLETIEQISSKNYKHLFSVAPKNLPRNTITTMVFLILVVFCLIVFRVAYAIENNSTLLLFISLINLLANAYVFISWPQQVSTAVEGWMRNNNIKSQTCQRMLRKVSIKLWVFSSILILVLVVWLVFFYLISCYELGADIVSIIALGVAILNDDIVEMLAIKFEKNIYYNK